MTGFFDCQGADYDTASKSIVFLTHNEVEKYSDARGTFEIWLKQPGTNVFRNYSGPTSRDRGQNS
jgi:hypothetical protein